MWAREDLTQQEQRGRAGMKYNDDQEDMVTFFSAGVCSLDHFSSMPGAMVKHCTVLSLECQTPYLTLVSD